MRKQKLIIEQNYLFSMIRLIFIFSTCSLTTNQFTVEICLHFLSSLFNSLKINSKKYEKCKQDSKISNRKNKLKAFLIETAVTDKFNNVAQNGIIIIIILIIIFMESKVVKPLKPWRDSVKLSYFKSYQINGIQ